MPIYTVYDIIMWEEQKSDPLASAARDHFLVLPMHSGMTSYCVSELTTAKSYLFVKF